MKTLPKVI
jgi:hypothetical protein